MFYELVSLLLWFVFSRCIHWYEGNGQGFLSIFKENKKNKSELKTHFNQIFTWEIRESNQRLYFLHWNNFSKFDDRGEVFNLWSFKWKTKQQKIKKKSKYILKRVKGHFFVFSKWKKLIKNWNILWIGI